MSNKQPIADAKAAASNHLLVNPVFGVTATLYFSAPQRTWSVLLDQPIKFGNGLIRAEVTLPDGRRFVGAARRPSVLGNSFELIEDGQP